MEIHLCACTPVHSHLNTHCPQSMWTKVSPIVGKPWKGTYEALLSQCSERTEPRAQGKAIQGAGSHCVWCVKTSNWTPGVPEEPSPNHRTPPNSQKPSTQWPAEPTYTTRPEWLCLSLLSESKEWNRNSENKYLQRRSQARSGGSSESQQDGTGWEGMCTVEPIHFLPRNRGLERRTRCGSPQTVSWHRQLSMCV